MTTASPPPPTCAACGATVTGPFCARCGAPTGSLSCPACHAPLSAGARFCHRCGASVGAPAAGGSREKVAWIVAGTAVLIAVAVIAFRFGGARPTVPEMGNAGNVSGVPPLSNRASDISQMSPRERFDRLFDRVVGAAERGDTVTVVQFAPMALASYGMLDRFDPDARYHAAMIHLAIGELEPAKALADTILAEASDHLFAYMIRGEAADRANDVAALETNYRAFLSRYDAQLKTGRVEYNEHRRALDDFRTRARATVER